MMIFGGIWMATCPRDVAQLAQDRDERHAPTPSEVWKTRIAGGVFVVAGGIFLYALLTKVPGADFLTP
jgi:hypothetical protein